MRTIKLDQLWIGNAHDLRDVRFVFAAGVRVVIDLAANEPPTLFPRDVVNCRLPLNDGVDNDEATLRVAILTAAEFIKRGVPTLVACSAGMSRSPAITAAAIALVEGRDPDEVLASIAATGPHDVAPGLWMEIKRCLFSS